MGGIRPLLGTGLGRMFRNFGELAFRSFYSPGMPDLDIVCLFLEWFHDFVYHDEQ